MSVLDGLIGVTNAQASRGDVIGVHRAAPGIGLYDHYGIYENDFCVYQYTGEPGDIANAHIGITTLEEFVKDSGGYFIRFFPERYEDYDSPGKRARESGLAALSQPGNMLEFAASVAYSALDGAYAACYHLYSPDETIARAKSRLGEKQYNLGFNNCEHYAVWCKTGLPESGQADAFMKHLATIWVKVKPYVTDPQLWMEIEDAVSSGVEAAGDFAEDLLDKIRSLLP